MRKWWLQPFGLQFGQHRHLQSGNLLLQKIHPAFDCAGGERQQSGIWIVSNFFDGMFFLPLRTCPNEVAGCKYVGVANAHFLRVSNEDASCLIIICTIFNLIEQGFNWLLWISCWAHMFKNDLKIDRSDVVVSLEEVIQHFSCWDIGNELHLS
jgi:hypothetical protein